MHSLMNFEETKIYEIPNSRSKIRLHEKRNAYKAKDRERRGGYYYKRGERELLAWQGSIEILRYQRHVHAHVRIIGRAKHRIRALVWRDPREVLIPPPLQFIDDKAIDEL